MTTTTPHDVVPAPRRDRDRVLAEVRGAVHVPGDPEYAALVTPWNVAVPVRPAVVVQPVDAEDVATTVRAASELGLRVAVQCTGHGAAGAAAGLLLVQTSRLDECTIHPQERWARVGAGVRWTRVVEQAASHGLAPLNGSSSGVGVVGYTTGGGLGPFARALGAASDRVRALEVVTGDGVLRRVTPDADPELFWGLRGGKGVLGIVTAVEFDLVELPAFFGGALFFDGADAEAVLQTWRTWCADLPEQATTSVAVLQLPPMPGVPPQLAGRTTVSVRFTWTGDPAEGAPLLEPLRAVAEPVLDGTGVLPYAAVDAVHADPVDPMPAAETGALLEDLPADAVRRLVELAGPGSGSPQVMVEVRQLGGALARPGLHDSALDHRDAPFTLLAVGIGGDPRVPQHARQLVEALAAWDTGRRLPNWSASDDPAVFARCHTPATLTRLRRAVAAYDPHGTIAQVDLLG
jgi:hypothetical protein